MRRRAVAVWLFVLLAATLGHARADSLEPLLLRSEEAPPEWRFLEERRAEDVSPIPEAVKAIQQRWAYRGQPFTVVYFLCKDLASATALYQRHVKVLGATAVVAPLGPVVVELHDAPSDVWPDAAVLLGLDQAQRRKVVSRALPSGWSLADEFLPAASVVADFAKNVDAPVQGLLVQRLNSPHGQVRVNYILCADREAALRVYERVATVSGRKTFITLDGQVVIEIVADRQDALLPTLEVVEAAPLLSRSPDTQP